MALHYFLGFGLSELMVRVGCGLLERLH